MRAMNRGLPCAAFFLYGFVLLFLSAVEAQPGFISIDCGLQEGEGYTENSTGISYVPDGKYVNTGETKIVTADGFARRYRTLRVFPEGERNCYDLRPLQVDGKYLVRAGFFYGDYDGRQSPPQFELHVGVNARETILLSPNETSVLEVLAVANGDSVWVCLVDTGRGTPLISTIELRPLPNLSYPAANASQSLLLRRRTNFGAEAQLRYPVDPYDRIWTAFSGSLPVINTTSPVESKPSDRFQVPSLVMRTAVTVPNISYFLRFAGAVGLPTDTVYIALHFAELQNLSLGSNRRVMDIFGSGEEVSYLRNYSALFLTASHVTVNDAAIGPTLLYNITLTPSNTTTLPPMINALEGFLLRKGDELPTDLGDVRAVQEIKAAYEIRKNWQGDPCVPKDYAWRGLGCAYYDGSKAPRIVSLNLSSSGLTGEIPAAIANLTALTTLDLSNNRISVAVADLLAKIPSLEILNLAGNILRGVSEDLCTKALKGGLSVRIEGLETACPKAAQPSPSPTSPRTSSSVSSKQTHYVYLTVSLAVAFVVRI